MVEKKEKVAVGISGGVDSAVAAALLKEQGHDVIGVHLYCWDKGPYCTANKDRASALRVAKHLNIPFVVWDLRKEYKKKVINYFFEEYRKGRTPNPDVMCNREIKFGIFMEKTLKDLPAGKAGLKVDKVATGHYARVARTPINADKDADKRGYHYRLLRGIDETKDQSYFLWILTPKQLEYILFPIGHMTKREVREKARELKLPCAERPDSQGICFIGPVDVSKFLRENLPIKKGPVVNTKGEVIGEHDGVWFYTEGQRRGFSVKGGQGYPLYVIKKDLKTNTLVVGRGKEAEVKEFEVGEVNWISAANSPTRRVGDFKPDGFFLGGDKVGVRIRHLGEIMPAILESVDSKPLATSPRTELRSGTGVSHKPIVVTLATPTRGVAPGQSTVFYQGEEVLGGGVIKETAIDINPTGLLK